MAFENVRTPANFAKLVEARKQLDEVLPDCDFAEGCGVDVEARRLTAQMQRDHITRMLNKLFPDGEPNTY